MREGIERAVEVDELHACCLDYLLDSLLDLELPVPSARLEAWVLHADRRRTGDEDTHPRGDGAQCIDQMAVVGDELIPIVGPVAGVGIVDPEVDHSDIGAEG